MLTTTAETNECITTVPVYLHVKRRRADEAAASRENVDDGAPPLVRVRWNVHEMGPPPFTTAVSDTTSGSRVEHVASPSLVFRRLTVAVGVANSANANGSPALEPAKTELCVLGVRRLRDSVVVDCGNATGESCGREPAPETVDYPNGFSRDTVTDIYVAESTIAASQECTTAAGAAQDDTSPTSTIAEEFRFDDLVIDENTANAAEDESAALRAVRQMGCDRRRPRSCTDSPPNDAANSDDGYINYTLKSLPTYTLRAAKRGRHEDGDKDAQGAWGEVTELSEVLTADWLAEAMRLVTLSEEAARAEARADLYCYPDHRRDDEYDSNAEDFSGNEYPDNDEDDGAEAVDFEGDVDSAFSGSNGHRHLGRSGNRVDVYGMFTEDGYRETSLGSGWGSDEDEDENRW